MSVGFLLGWWKCYKIDCGHDCTRFGVTKVELSSLGKIEKTCTLLPQRTFSTNLSHTLTLFYILNLAEGFRDHNSELSLEIVPLSVSVSLCRYLCICLCVRPLFCKFFNCNMTLSTVTWPETLKPPGPVCTNTMLTCHLAGFLDSPCSQGMGLLNNWPLDHGERPWGVGKDSVSHVCVCMFSNLNYPEFHPTMRVNTQTHGLFNRIILDVLPHGWPLQGIQTTDTSVNL